MRYVNLNILIILLGIIGGISIASILLPPFYVTFIIALSLLLSFAIHLYLYLKKYIFRYGFVWHTLACSVAVGALVTVVHTPTAYPSHYTHLLTPDDYYVLQGNIVEQVSQKDYGTTYCVKLSVANKQSVTGDILCFFPSKLTDSLLSHNTPLTFVAKCNPIPPPKNPYQFNYKQYMERKGVYWKANVIKYQAQPINSHQMSDYIERARNYLSSTINHTFNKDTAPLLNTLLLSKRSELSEELYQSYIDAGAVHILAISGLHVGIITMILLFLLQKLPYATLPYQWLRYILLLAGLWAFALIAGASASVLRATVMFSFIGLSFLFRNRQGRFDALLVSMFFLLLYNPYYLYDVGFQLSYAAVFSILTFYPPILRWWYPNNKYLNKVWSLFIIGFTAQIVVLPISLYYFHQFSILFFVSNLVVVPLLSPLLVVSSLSLVIMAIGLQLPYPFIFITEKLVWLMNALVQIIAQQEPFIVRNIYFNIPLLISCLLIVASVVYFRHYRSYKAIMAISFSILLWQGVRFYNKYHIETTEEMLIFSKYNDKVIAIRQGSNLTVYQNDTLQLDPIVMNYLKNSGADNIHLQKMPYTLRFKNKNYLLMDTLGVYPKSKQVVIDSVIFTQKIPKINLDRMKEDLSLRY